VVTLKRNVKNKSVCMEPTGQPRRRRLRAKTPRAKPTTTSKAKAKTTPPMNLKCMGLDELVGGTFILHRNGRPV